jgi:DMSO/TMAO reductase YedYZ molybdopterin-dependent catalytic subunit
VIGGLAVLGYPSHQWAQGEASYFDFSLLDDWLTPNDLFFLRHHSAIPTVAPDGWTLSITGEVDAPYQVDYRELKPSRSLAATIECAENSVGGGLVSNAEWTGIELSGLLGRAKPRSSARFVRLYGADDYVRTIPLSKATHPDSLIAVRMNGDELPVAHGSPARAVIPGWYGMDSVKWLSRVELAAENLDQMYQRRTQNGPAESVTGTQIKAVFARPLDGAIISGRRFLVRGAAWAGEETISGVELSTDGGRSWRKVRLRDVARPYAWVRWELEWAIGAPGDYELVVRTADTAGRVSPATRDSSRLDGYEQNHYQRVLVRVLCSR